MVKINHITIKEEISKKMKNSHLESLAEEDLEQEFWVIALEAAKKFKLDEGISDERNEKRFRIFIRTSLRNGFLNLRRTEYRSTLSEKTQQEKDRVKNTLNIGDKMLLLSNEEKTDLEELINKTADQLTPDLRSYFLRHINGVSIPKTKLEKIRWLLRKDD